MFNKFDLMNKLNQLEISITKSYISSNFNWQIPPPVFLKPNIGRGSRGIKKVFSKSQYQIYKEENFRKGDILIQPIFSGIEYTVGVLSNTNNKIISISPKRIIRKNGITINAVTENNTIIDKLAIEITKHLEPRGPFNIQLFVTKENRPIVFEINPRFSTTLVLSIEAGIDEVDLLVIIIHAESKQYYAKEGSLYRIIRLYKKIKVGYFNYCTPSWGNYLRKTYIVQRINLTILSRNPIVNQFECETLNFEKLD